MSSINPSKEELAEAAERVSVRSYLETRCDERTARSSVELHRLADAVKALDTYTRDRFNWLEESTNKLATNMDRRLDGMNEFRGALTDQSALYATRKEMEALHQVIESDLRVLRDSRAKLEGSASQNSVLVALAFAAAGVLIGVVNILMRVMGK